MVRNSLYIRPQYWIPFLSVVLGILSPLWTLAQVNVTTRTIQANVNLVWEADSYVPPFYKGRALMPDGGNARIVAFLPTDLAASAADATYTWRVDGTVDDVASGVGRNTYNLRSPIFGGQSIVVVTVSIDGTDVGTGALRIPLVEPDVLVYADSPLEGVLFNTAQPHFLGKELSIETYPLFFTTSDRTSPDLLYGWKLNGLSVENPSGNSGRLTLISETTGTTTIDVSVSNANRMLESAAGKLTLILR